MHSTYSELLSLIVVQDAYPIISAMAADLMKISRLIIRTAPEHDEKVFDMLMTLGIVPRPREDVPFIDL